jgi:hypothetical protein
MSEMMNEQNYSDYSIAELRFHDIKEPFSMDNLQNMVSAIRLVNAAGYNLPGPIKADLQIRVFHLFKTIQDQIKDFQDNFTDILQQKIDKSLQMLEAEEKEKEKQKAEAQKK